MEYTEKEAILRERAAFCEGAANARITLHAKRGTKYSFEETLALQKESQEEAEKTYPLPKVLRNRTVVLESGVMRFKREVQYRADMQGFYITFPNGSSTDRADIFGTLTCCAVSSPEADVYWELLKDLKKNPTELVDAE
jgi:hypothetical protein